MQLNQCFFDRNDALFAGSSVIERLHSQSQRASGDEIAIMTGGLLTHSSLCDHLLWHCPYFRDIRSLPQSYDPVVTRLGWNQDIQLPILLLKPTGKTWQLLRMVQLQWGWAEFLPCGRRRLRARWRHDYGNATKILLPQVTAVRQAEAKCRLDATKKDSRRLAACGQSPALQCARRSGAAAVGAEA